MNADRLMRNMMQSMGMGMGMPFGAGIFDDAMMSANPGQHHSRMDPFSSMMPHGLMNPMMMMDPFQSMQRAMSVATNESANNGFSYCSSSVTTYTTDEQGRPQVYQQSNEVKQGPNGLKETKAAVRDSRTGRQEIAIGHHLHEKARIKKKSKNAYTGEEEQVEDLVNLDETEADTFEQNWQQQARNATSYHLGPTRNRLALTNGCSTSRAHSDPHHSPPLSSDKVIKKEKKKRKSKDEKHK